MNLAQSNRLPGFAAEHSLERHVRPYEAHANECYSQSAGSVRLVDNICRGGGGECHCSGDCIASSSGCHCVPKTKRVSA